MPACDDLLVPADRRETVGAAERRDAAGSLSHRIRGERRAVRSSSAVSTSPTSRYSVRPISLLTLTASRAGTTVRSCAPRPASSANHRRDELVKREDRRRRKAGKHDDRAAARRRQADRLARLERDAVRDDAGIAQFGDDAIRQIARALARAAGEQHDVGDLERVLQPLAQRGHVVVGDAQPHRLAAELAHGIGEHLGVRVVDLRRLHRLAGRDDFVAGGEDGDDRLSPDVDASRRRSRPARRCRGWSAADRGEARSRPPVMSVPANDTPLPARDRPGDPQLAAARPRRARP